MTVIGAEQVLADENRFGFGLARSGKNAFVEQDDRSAGLEGVFQAVDFFFMLGRFEGQIEHSQGEHHLREIARGIRNVLAEERFAGFVIDVVAPEAVGLHQLGQLLGDAKFVVIVFGPLLGLIERRRAANRDSS